MMFVDHPEYQYMDMMDRLSQGPTSLPMQFVPELRQIQGESLKYDLSNHAFPLVTVRRLAPERVIRELLWIMSGNTNVEKLMYEDEHPWMSCREKDAGPHWGYNLRHWGEVYQGKLFEVEGKDQLVDMIRQLLSDKSFRRWTLMLSNPDIQENKHPHTFDCRYISMTFSETPEVLNLVVNISRADGFLDVPYDVAEMAVFLSIIARTTHRTPKNLTVHFDTVHMLARNGESVHKLLSRTPRPIPRLNINKGLDSIDNVLPKDVLIDNYEPCQTISYK